MASTCTSTSPLTRSVPPRSTSPLLLLPVELRLQIYTYLLSNLTTASSHTSKRISSSSTTTTPINAAILLVNRQLNSEATPILYSQNTFLAHPSLLTSFPRLLPSLPPIREPSVLGLIRRVHFTIRLDIDPAFSAEAARIAFSGLEELTIELAQGYFLGAGCQNLRALESVRGVRRVNICGSTMGFELYLGWLRGVMMSEPGVKVDSFKPVEECFWVDKFVKCNQLVVV
ncbi:hypothetical protein NLU13_1913 [Sarocladium strictum]|uniref:Uncharacterized protein n=1 Tax=Sarocladium strictum TaxID=5046 RepID=A0AA39LCN6_SARSR|nr:hypothetical protein NLU13_1913 [Sarocladium strictum]